MINFRSQTSYIEFQNPRIVAWLLFRRNRHEEGSKLCLVRLVLELLILNEIGVQTKEHSDSVTGNEGAAVELKLGIL